MNRLADASASQVVELPRLTESGYEPNRRQRLAAVAAAYHAGVASGQSSPLLLGWCRLADADPVHLFTAGGIAGSKTVDGLIPVTLPVGGLGVPYQEGELVRMLTRLPHWIRVNAVFDGLLAQERRGDDGQRPLSLEECLLRVWRGAFGWLMLAEPVAPEGVAELAQLAAFQEREAQTKASSPEHAVRAERLGLRHRELRQGESTGVWRLNLLAGGFTPAEAAAVASLLCSSVDLTQAPYALVPAHGPADLATGLSAEPTVTGSSLVAALAAGPSSEIPGVRLAIQPDFDITMESEQSAGEARISLGTVLDGNGVATAPLTVALSSLNRHTFVCGATGAGKSQTVRHLLEGASAAGLPWLVVEPAKAEYRQMADRLGAASVIAIRPGDPGGLPAGFNPLRPAAGFPLQTHVDLTRALFLAAFQADEPFPQVVATALIRCYERLGWDLALGEPRVPGSAPRYPTLGDLQRVAERIVQEIGYGREVTDNVLGFIRIRLSSLRLGTTGRFFEGGHPLDFEKLLRHNVVFEIEDVGDDRDKAFLMGALLVQLVEHLRVKMRAHPELAGGGLRHITVFEEAHRLLRRTEQPGPAGQAVELFAALLAEIRAYGEGLVIAEQIPTKLVPDVIKNTAVKVMHRLPALDDRIIVGATANVSDTQSRYLVTLSPGVGAVFADGMDHPILVKMPDGSGREMGGATPTAAATSIIGRRSSTCGPICVDQPCSLRDMRTAQHLLGDEPWLVLWAELAVLGHLTGWPVPALRAKHLSRLWQEPRQRLECALSHAVDDAIDTRSTVLSWSATPQELAAHVLGALHGQLVGEGRCEGEEAAFLSKAFRWVRVWESLRGADPSARHPRTSEWESTYHTTIPGATAAEQVSTVRERLDADQRDPDVLKEICFGSRRPSTLEQTIGSTFEADNWAIRLRAGIAEHFAGASWPERQLAPRSAEAQKRR